MRVLMYESPQKRRLRSDLAAMERLAEESSIVTFREFGTPATRYLIEFRGRSLARDKGKVAFRDEHQVEIKLGTSYPRTMPELRWLSPVYHPNISEIGLVCLGGYGTHWVPSLHLDELCQMLWDMCRYHNYDIRSPYNRDAALWAAHQTTYAFPTDARPLRDRRVALGRIESGAFVAAVPATPPLQDTDVARRLISGEAVTVLDQTLDLRRSAGSAGEVAAAPPAPPEPEPQPEVVFLD